MSVMDNDYVEDFEQNEQDAYQYQLDQESLEDDYDRQRLQEKQQITKTNRSSDAIELPDVSLITKINVFCILTVFALLIISIYSS